ncbi:MAG TPA: hypothetical protein VJS44_08200 [Pyrinomonadaceae bacterium]|nr:hypothetical protein [Pyrinomonadaceae bacterium]
MPEIKLQENGLPEGFKDALYCETYIKFDWRDRLKILFGAKVELRTQTFTENQVGKTLNGENRLRVWIREPRLPKGWGYVEASSEPKA